MSIYLINNIIVPLEEEADFRREALRALRCKGSDLLKVDIYRKSVDARKKENIIIPVTYVVVGLEEILRPFFGVGHPMEFPCTVQSLIIGGFLDAQA